MNTESPWKKNPMLNLGALFLCVGMLILSFLEQAQLLGTVIAITGFAMFYIGYRKAKAPGASRPPLAERRKKLRILMIWLVLGFVISPILLWPQISKLRGMGIWFFAVGDILCFAGMLGFYAWVYKKTGRDEIDGA